MLLLMLVAAMMSSTPCEYDDEYRDGQCGGA